jgi:DNA repair protein RadC
MEEGNPKHTYRISDMLEDDKPRERLALQGPSSLSNGELIAILLRVGVKGESAIQVGNRLLKKFNGLRGLYKAPFNDLQREHGLGLAKTAQLKAAIELGRRLTIESPEDRPAINSPKDAADLVLYEMSILEQEEFRVMLLDRRNKVMETNTLYRGSVSSSQIRIGEVFKEAVRKNSSSIIIIHNHPTGDPTPSTDDISVTRAIIQAGKILDIEVLDHIVIGSGIFASMKEKGLCFTN